MKVNYKYTKPAVVKMIFTVLLVLALIAIIKSYFKYIGYNTPYVYTDHIMAEDDAVDRMTTATTTVNGTERRFLYYIVKNIMKGLL